MRKAREVRPTTKNSHACLLDAKMTQTFLTYYLRTDMAPAIVPVLGGEVTRLHSRPRVQRFGVRVITLVKLDGRALISGGRAQLMAHVGSFRAGPPMLCGTSVDGEAFGCMTDPKYGGISSLRGR
jgi:hypothetical protein